MSTRTPKDRYGRTPLLWAAGNGHEAMVRLLVVKAVDPDSRDRNGWTPLSWAAKKGYKVVTALL